MSAEAPSSTLPEVSTRRLPHAPFQTFRGPPRSHFKLAGWPSPSRHARLVTALAARPLEADLRLHPPLFHPLLASPFVIIFPVFLYQKLVPDNSQPALAGRFECEE